MDHENGHGIENDGEKDDGYNEIEKMIKQAHEDDDALNPNESADLEIKVCHNSILVFWYFGSFENKIKLF